MRKVHHGQAGTYRYVSFLIVLALACCLRGGASDSASPVPVRYREGIVHGFLALSTLEGDSLADGDLIQSAHGDRISSQVIFHFKDGSLQDETTVFSQHRDFQLISYHLIQKGPAFPHAVDLSVVASTGEVTVHYTDEGKEKTITEHLKLPPDLANGLVPTMLKNLRPGTPEITASLVVATPKPRIVKLVIHAAGEDPFSLGASNRKALRYVVKVEIGGIAGVVAPLVGKQPPDASIWILPGDAPTFVKSEALSYMDGPLWRTELISPTWPRTAANAKNGSASMR